MDLSIPEFVPQDFTPPSLKDEEKKENIFTEVMTLSGPDTQTPVKDPNSDRNLKKYSGAALRLLNLMISGAKQEEAARAVGVSAQYLTQLMKEEDFQIQILEGQRVVSEKAIAIDNDLLETESILSKKLREMAEFVTSPGEAIRMFKEVNSAKRKTSQGMDQFGDSAISGAAGSGSSGTVVNIILPSFIQQQFVVNPNQEIIGIGEKELVTIDSRVLNKMVSPGNTIKELPTRWAGAQKQVKQMPNSIPNSGAKIQDSSRDKKHPSQWSIDEL